MLNRLNDLRGDNAKENAVEIMPKNVKKDKDEKEINEFINMIRTNITNTNDQLNKKIDHINEIKQKLSETILESEQDQLLKTADKIQMEIQQGFG